MYNELSISTLETRIGWEKPLDTDFAITLDSEVLKADSERKVNSFHQLAIVENVYAAVQKIEMESVEFNAFLTSIRRQSVLEIMTAIFEKSDQYDEANDYSELIISKPRLFDDAIGYCIAVKILELFISSGRKNFRERNANLAFQSLKIELEGVRNDGGFYVAKGIKYELKNAISTAQKIIFPIKPIVQDGKAW